MTPTPEPREALAWSCGWPAPAKLNLFLHITGQRDDGYHTLQTLFQFLNRGDCLALRVRSDRVIQRVQGADEVAAGDDLVERAASALQSASGTGLGADIAVSKHLPIGGGLGGGSSDAATTLLALNHLWGINWSRQRLAAIGQALGADVPIFLHGRAAWGEGVGEILTDVEPHEPWYLVIVPPVTVATGELFRAPELTRDCPPMTMRDFLASGGSNVFELPVRKRCQAVADSLDWLAGQGTTPRLTGTGACVFGAFANETQARAAHARLPADWHGFTASGTNRSPLATKMATLTGS